MAGNWTVLGECPKGHRMQIPFDSMQYLKRPAACPTCTHFAGIAARKAQAKRRRIRGRLERRRIDKRFVDIMRRTFDGDRDND